MIENSFDLVIDNSEFDSTGLSNEYSDIINILNPTKETIAEHKDYFLRPLKIGFEMDLPENIDEYFSTLTKNRRKKLKKNLKLAENVKIKIENPLTKETFLKWHELYRDKMNNKEKGKVIIGNDWLDKRDNICGIFAYEEDMIGGIILKKLDSKLSISYNAYVDSEFSVSDLLIVEAVKYAIENEYKILSRGQDTNLYGHHLSPGLYLYKKSLGFRVVARMKAGFALTKFNNFDKFGDIIFFVSFADENMDSIEKKKKKKKEIEDDYKCCGLKRGNVYSTQHRIFS